MRIRTAIVAAGLATATVLGGATTAAAKGGDTDANGLAANSPGVISGNVIQVPIDIPINLCGNTINVIGLLNPASGNVCIQK